MTPISKCFFMFIQFSLLVITSNATATGGGTVFDITTYGAKPNGDATQGLMAAWKAACDSTNPSTVLVPKGSYQLGPSKLNGPCKSRMTVEILGNFTAPAEPARFDGENAWFKVEYVDNLNINASNGAGIFDGQGSKAWKLNNCSESAKCDSLPYNFRFMNLTNSAINGITSLNSKLFHITIHQCKQLKINNITVTAPADSPNTDGIHIVRSEEVQITNVQIGTGDDCVSIGDGATNVLIQQVTCGPGHGISVGSLGKYPNEEPVSGVTVKDCVIKNTENGVRVKTWHKSYAGSASSLHFVNIVVDNVKNPIVVDQEYCPHGLCKVPATMAQDDVRLFDIQFKNIRGTSDTKEVVSIVCSSNVPCEKVELSDIDLQYHGKDSPGVSVCKNVNPVITGKQNPPACTAHASTNTAEL